MTIPLKVKTQDKTNSWISESPKHEDVEKREAGRESKVSSRYIQSNPIPSHHIAPLNVKE
jgi:hypothetical protein